MNINYLRYCGSELGWDSSGGPDSKCCLRFGAKLSAGITDTHRPPGLWDPIPSSQPWAEASSYGGHQQTFAVVSHTGFCIDQLLVYALEEAGDCPRPRSKSWSGPWVTCDSICHFTCMGYQYIQEGRSSLAHRREGFISNLKSGRCQRTCGHVFKSWKAWGFGGSSRKALLCWSRALPSPALSLLPAVLRTTRDSLKPVRALEI